MRRKLFLAVSAMVALAACNDVNKKDERVVVPRGARFRAVADSLVAHHVIEHPMVFRLYAMAKRKDRSVRAGSYVLKGSMSWSEMLDVLNGSGKSVEASITIPEGWDLTQIVPQLARVLGVPQDSVQAAVRDTALLHALDVPTTTLEGYLFPDTYVFPDGTTARAAVKLMVDRFNQIWQPAWDSTLQVRAMTRNDVMSLAAIVEKEARLPEERPVIAAVYLNRVKAGIKLEADPTVQYAMGHHVARVYFKDLKIDSPYNTYMYKGLPPGPIASPGKPSIVAALNPASVPYLFFVAHPDGHHQFTSSFSQHTVAVRAARREWDSVAAVRRDTLRANTGPLPPPR